MTRAFRPQSWNGKYKLKNPRVSLYNHHERRPCGSHILRVGGQLHYLASHAPRPIMQKWRGAWCKFYKRYHKVI
jgi:hypothetical protein